LELRIQVIVKPVLLFAYGNVSRGDDALAPLLLEKIQALGIIQVAGHPLKFLTDFQMQIEHVMDMQGCERILLIDADSSINQPYKFYPVKEQQDTLYTTHGMTPSTLLHTYRQVLNEPPPSTAMLAVPCSGAVSMPLMMISSKTFGSKSF